MQTYQNMKDSGVAWLGDIPSDWNIKKLRYLARISTGNSIKDEDKHKYEDSYNSRPYISSKDINLLTTIANYNNGRYIKYTEKKFKVAPQNSTLICIEGGSAGKKITFTKKEVSYVNKLCNIDAYNANQKFIFYFLQSESFKNEFNLETTGLIGGVSKTKLANFIIPTPDFMIQEIIADYLDKETAKIDNLISKQENLLKLLEEKRRVSIGIFIKCSNLNTNEERFRDICTFNPQIKVDFGPDDIVSFYPMESIGEDGLIEHNQTRKYSEVKTGYSIFQNNDVIVAKVTPCFENYKGAHITNVFSNIGFGTTELFVLRPNDKIEPEYLYWLTQTIEINNFLAGGMRGTGGLKRVVPEEFKNYKVYLPHRNKQREITKNISLELAKFNKLKLKCQTQIDLLKERRISLISNAVTGKIRT